ncbi:helix-turn-helix domain-containing protein [Sphingomonas sp.]|uniref:helix-turn-helix domain-containing protein n=1 Tax=Sphingomonas sp. TaxID=28214 RepID=UPI0025FE7BC1|nr:helix-turn-helix domain-containing protein [Sphingomonas sp.]
MVDGEIPEKSLFPVSVGERLRMARETAKLDLNDVSTRTRIPLRHLTAIENSDYAALPSHTYALGFAKSYARAIGMDEVALATDLRTELGRSNPGARDTDVYEPADPSRVPPRLLAWTAALLALVIVIAYGVWRAGFFGENDAVFPATEAASQQATAPVVVQGRAAALVVVPAGRGQVALTATVPVWLRITDATKAVLIQKELAAGETYQVPLTATDPRILTGRPDALKVTIDGREVAPLGTAQTTIRNAPLNAAALNARTPASALVATPSAAPGSRAVAGHLATVPQ